MTTDGNQNIDALRAGSPERGVGGRRHPTTHRFTAAQRHR
jgi:hypothetical protein